MPPAVCPQAQPHPAVPAPALLSDVPAIVKARGPLKIRDAYSYAQSIPPNERHSGGCHKVLMEGGCCIGCSCHCGDDCLWAPTCLFCNPLIFLMPMMCFMGHDGVGHAATRASHFMYEVDRESHTKACYGRWGGAIGSSMVKDEPEATPCCYCVPL